MKNNKIIAVLCSTLMICTTALVSCGDSESSGDKDVTKKPVDSVSLDIDDRSSEFVGNWTATGVMDKSGNVTSLEDFVKENGGDIADYNYKFVINSDKTGVFTENGESVDGKWSSTGSTLTFEGNTFKLQDDGTLIRNLSDGSGKLVFSK